MNNSNKQEWNFHPTIPLDKNPLFLFPLSVKKIFHWYLKMWSPPSETFICLLFALTLWYFVNPLLEIFTVNLKNIFYVYILNLIIVFFVAGGLHLYLYSLNKQKDILKYVIRKQSNNKKYILNSQVLDNMFWTIVSGVTVWTIYQILYMWSYSKGIVPLSSFSINPFWFCILFLLITLWNGIHFYFIHRLLHFPFLYKIAHHVHHRNINPGPWSGISMHPIEHILYFSAVLIHFIIPSHPLHVFFHFIILSVGAIWGHAGFDALVIAKKNKVPLGHFDHQLHHRYFECNYGTFESPCDKWFNTFHDGTPEATEIMRNKRRKIHNI